jgi:hypothetical protein
VVVALTVASSTPIPQATPIPAVIVSMIARARRVAHPFAPVATRGSI